MTRPLGAAAAPHAATTESAAAPNLAMLAAEHFEPLVGETFALGNGAVTLKKVRRGQKSGARFREQFSVVFHAPQQLSIGTEPLLVSHPAVGRLELLVTRIGNRVDCAALEVCFA